MNATALHSHVPHLAAHIHPVPALRPTVLIADDEPDVLTLMKRILSGCGIDSIPAENGIAAWQKFNEMPPRKLSALVTDMDMPGKNGLELSLLVREANPDLPVLMVSGNFDEDLARSLLACRNIYLLRKPFTLEQFRSVMQKVLPGFHID